MRDQNGRKRLLDYLSDMVLEEQLKLGYERETIRFYLPVSSVEHILFPAESAVEHILFLEESVEDAPDSGTGRETAADGGEEQGFGEKRPDGGAPEHAACPALDAGDGSRGEKFADVDREQGFVEKHPDGGASKHAACPAPDAGDGSCSEKSGEHVIIQVLESLCDDARETLGEVTVSRCSGERICFVIPPEGAAYVHEHHVPNPFLADLIAFFGRHEVTPEGVRELFWTWSDRVRCIRTPGGEFDEVYYFEDGVPDSYRYCVKYDLGQASYHRFLKEDFEELSGQISGMAE